MTDLSGLGAPGSNSSLLGWAVGSLGTSVTKDSIFARDNLAPAALRADARSSLLFEAAATFGPSLIFKGAKAANTWAYAKDTTIEFNVRWKAIADGDFGYLNQNLRSVERISPEDFSYEFNAVAKPGPLSDLRGEPAKNFLGGRYNAIKLDEDLVVYRAGNGGGGKNTLGSWWTREIPESVAKVRIDSAVKEQWIDPVTQYLTGTSPANAVYGIKIPKGTMIYEGPVGYQSDVYLGGMDKMQIYIHEPWNLDYVKVFEAKLK
jgi:filamentous hemagglutinin